MPDPWMLIPVATLIAAVLTGCVTLSVRASRERQEIRERLARLEERVDNLIGWLKSVDRRNTE